MALGSPSFQAELSQQLSLTGQEELAVSIDLVYYESSALKSLIQQLTHQACFGDGVSLVIGETRSGKSTVARQLEKALSDTAQLYPLCLRGDTHTPELIKSLVQGFSLGVDLSSTGEQIAALRRFCQLLVQEKRLAVLLIDNAGHISEQALGILLGLLQGQGEGGVGLHIAFFAEPGLDTLIDKLQVLDVAVYDFDIPSLTQAEIPDFLRAANFDVSILGGDTLNSIWKASSGGIGRVLAFAEANLQLSGQVEGDGESGGSPLPVIHLGLIGVLLLGLIFGVWFKHQDTVVFPKPEALVPTLPPDHTLGVEAVPVSGLETVFDDTVSGEGLNKTSKTTKENIRKVVDLGGELVNATDKIINSNGVGQKLLDEEGGLAAVSTVPASTPTIDNPQPVLSIRPVEVDPLSSDSIQAFEGSAQAVNKKASLTNKSQDESFLLLQDPEKYTLQVIAANNGESLAVYVARQPNRNALYLFRGERDGKHWYVVVEGVYGTRELALQAIGRLPKEQSKGGPWPRKLKAIQDEIRKTQ